MPRKLFVFFLLTLIGSVLLAACATGAEPTATTRPPTATATAEATADAAAATAEATEAATVEATVEATADAAVTAEATEDTAAAATADATEAVAAATEDTVGAAAATVEATEAVAEATVEATEEGPSVVDVIQSTEDLSLIYSAVLAANLVETLESEGPFTVFAPSNEAVTAALENLGVTAEEFLTDTEALTNILTYHVVPGRVLSSDLVSGDVTTVQGGVISVVVNEDGSVVLNDSVNVITADLEGANGVVHIIDAVLQVPVVEATAEATDAAAATAEATDAAVAPATAEATEVAAATAEATEVAMATMEATEVTAATAEATEVAAATAEATEVAAATAEATETAGTVNRAGSIESVCLVTDVGSIDDGTFNQLAYNGMVRAAEEFGLEAKYIETQNQADYTNNIQTCIDENYGAIITVGFLITDATLAAAQANPNIYFIGVDQGFAEAPENLVGIQFREDQAGFLAGAMAALMSESGVVGGVYGMEIPAVIKFRNGFEQGARYINPEIRVLGVYVGSFTATAEGGDAADSFIGEGADVIFGAGGQTGSGAILRAAENNVRVIGVDQDEFFTTFGRGATPGSEFLITSAIKRVDEGIFQMLNALSEGDYGWPTTGNYIMDAAVDGVGFAPANNADVPEEVTARVQEIFEMLKTGELSTGVDPITGELLEVEGAATEEATPEATPGS